MKKRNKCSLSHYKLFSCQMGYLYPMALFEVLPGDTIQQFSQLLVRLNPLNFPVMHPLHCRVHHFFVPFRLLWEDWEDFITGGRDGLDASVFPTMAAPAATGYLVQSLADYLGIQPDVPDVLHSALPFRAYSLIWNEYYRDNELQNPLTISLASGTDTTTNRTGQTVNWEKDYFTKLRPDPQLGADVTLPFNSNRVPVLGIGKQDGTFASSNVTVRESDGTTQLYATASEIDAGASTTDHYTEEGGGARGGTAGYPNIFGDLSGLIGTIPEFWQANALQRFMEARSRYGSRYTEYLRYLGVRPSDARLQRPEYLGGGRQTIQFSEVLQTGVTTDADEEGVGNMAGHGIAGLRSNRYRRFFEEHGFVMSLFSMKPKTVYGQGLHRLWNRRTKEDFWQKEFEHIGQQETLNKEVQLDHNTPDGVFGYGDRYAEYREHLSSIAGNFRTTEAAWHMARLFTAGTTALNSAFIAANPTNRIFQVTDPTVDQVKVMAMHSIQARRLVSGSAKARAL